MLGMDTNTNEKTPAGRVVATQSGGNTPSATASAALHGMGVEENWVSAHEAALLGLAGSGLLAAPLNERGGPDSLQVHQPRLWYLALLAVRVGTDPLGNRLRRAVAQLGDSGSAPEALDDVV
jgi:hypothetical protein